MENVKRFVSRIGYHLSQNNKNPITLLPDEMDLLLYNHHFQMINDEERVSLFEEAIREVVQPDDVVADLGAGTGILSFFAAEKARKVYSVEIFPSLLALCKETAHQNGLNDKIVLVPGDARYVRLPEKVDVVICQMLDTALIKESQVAVMNHAVEELLRDDGRVVPRACVTRAQLVHVNYHVNGFEFKVPYDESDFASGRVTPLSEEEEVHRVDFREVNVLGVEKEVGVEVTREGVLNGLRVTSMVSLTDSIVLEATQCTLRPYVFPLDELSVVEGQRVSVKLSYELGGGLRTLRTDVLTI